jgi:hypothetical protein
MPKTVIERHGNADAVLLGQAHRAADEIAVVEDVVMRQRHALRRSRGAAGELDIDRIIELQRLPSSASCSRCRAAAHAGHSSKAMVPAIWARRSGSPRAVAAAARLQFAGCDVASSGSSVFSISM